MDKQNKIMADVDGSKAGLGKLIDDITIIIFKADQYIFINTPIYILSVEGGGSAPESRH